VPNVLAKVGTGSDERRPGVVVCQNQLPEQSGSRLGSDPRLSGSTVLDEYRKAKAATEAECDRLREAYYEAQRWKEKQDIDGGDVDKRYAREHLILAYQDWHDSRDLLAELARFIKPVWIREMKRQRDEFAEMESAEMV
jgi:hypothetical protein